MALRQRIYLETTVWYQMANYASSGFKGRVEQLFSRIEKEDYSIFISDVVLEEFTFNSKKYRARVEELITRFRPTVVLQGSDADIVSAAYIENAFRNRESEEVVVDAYHAAVAVTSNITYMASYNYRNLLNVRILEHLNAINLLAGLNRHLSIYPPFMFLDLEKYDGETGSISDAVWNLKAKYGEALVERLKLPEEKRRAQRRAFAEKSCERLGLQLVHVEGPGL
jgi:predicted nucleic acid-binding protein